jgi:hypothetical protein
MAEESAAGTQGLAFLTARLPAVGSSKGGFSGQLEGISELRRHLSSSWPRSPCSRSLTSTSKPRTPQRSTCSLPPTVSLRGGWQTAELRVASAIQLVCQPQLVL